LLAKKGWDPVLGARPLRRTIQREIEDSLSEKILFGELIAGRSSWSTPARARTASPRSFSVVRPSPRTCPTRRVQDVTTAETAEGSA
jgi:ATP-dependent Clp protease ATP-binding subunit ClpC